MLFTYLHAGPVNGGATSAFQLVNCSWIDWGSCPGFADSTNASRKNNLVEAASRLAVSRKLVVCLVESTAR